jgi:hypothetical protein
MLLRIRDLRGDRIHAEDSEVGSVDELYFDDEAWDVRYLAVDTRGWLPGSMLLISPEVIERIDWREKTVHVSLAREEIPQAPEVCL